MSETPSILTAEQRKNLEAYFNNLVARAEAAPPDIRNFSGREQEFMAAKAAYQSNPIAPVIQALKKEQAELTAAGSAQSAQKIYAARLEEEKTRFLSGADRGAPDPNAEQNQEGIIQSFLSGDFLGAIKKMVLAIPFVGDAIAAGMKWLKVKMSGGDMDLATARQRITLEKSLDGAGANLGLSGDALIAFRQQGIHAAEHPDQLPEVPAPSNPEAAQKAADETIPRPTAGSTVLFDSLFNAPNGETPQSRPITAPSSRFEAGAGITIGR